VKAIAAALTPEDRVIIVSSKAHTRRVRVIWRSLEGARPEAIVRYARADRANLDQWWESTGTFMAVSREWAGILNAEFGFPVGSW
jgi:hypothetical protein